MATTYSQQLLDRAQAYVRQPLTARRYDEGLTEISQLYAAITGEAVGQCRQCQYSDFMAVITAFIREATRIYHPELMADSQYTFAPGFAGEVIADGRYKKTVTAENLTDEDAEALLKLGYGHVIVLKPAQQGAAPDSQGTTLGLLDESTEKSQAELDLEAEQDAHDDTKEALANLKSYYDGIESELKTTKADLLTEQQGRATAEQQVKDLQGKLTDTQGQLATAQQKLTRKAPAAAPAAALATGAASPSAAPVASTSEAGSTPASAPAPPSEAAAGTAGN